MAAKSNDLFYTLREIEDEPFVMYRLSSGVCSTSCFSEVDFTVQPVVENGSKVALALFKVDVVNDVKAEHAQAVEFIRKSKSYQWPPQAIFAARCERDICKIVCNEILIPLCATNDVVLEKRYRKIVCEFPGLSCKDLGLGTLETWHGTPDVVVRGTPVVVSHGDTDNFDGSASNGWSTQVEAKPLSHLPQVIATSIVASFTEYNCHSSMNPMVYRPF